MCTINALLEESQASPNHDAVAWRVVDDVLAEEIMQTIDDLDKEIRPNTFILPNTDAGGGVRSFALHSQLLRSVSTFAHCHHFSTKDNTFTLNTTRTAEFVLC
jgi:hypothetical protein